MTEKMLSGLSIGTNEQRKLTTHLQAQPKGVRA